MEAATKRGRPISAERSDHIVNHAWELLQANGYDGLRMSDVAERAGVGLATIYRRWPTKRELVHAALGCATLPFDLPTTDDPRADVLAVLTELARGLNTGGDQNVASFLSCAREDPEMAAVWHKATTLKLDLYLRDRLAVALGEDHPELAVRAQAGPAILMYQASIFGEQLQAEALARQLTEMLFAGAPAPA
jgi:AcrR family transcriptional regulator